MTNEDIPRLDVLGKVLWFRLILKEELSLLRKDFSRLLTRVVRFFYEGILGTLTI